MFSACAYQQHRYPPVVPTHATAMTIDTNKEISWWACRFKISWPVETEFNHAADLMLAHAVVGPELKRYSRDLYWWRFHRRAARDETGHQFSFLFYTDANVASGVMENIKQNIILDKMLAEKIVERIIFDDPERPKRHLVEDTSDPNWSLTLQRNWPSFIMGVSALWLGLIDDGMTNIAIHDDVSIMIKRYESVDTAITNIWRDEGQHALLHHLNAIFGYEPLLIKKEIRF